MPDWASLAFAWQLRPLYFPNEKGCSMTNHLIIGAFMLVKLV